MRMTTIYNIYSYIKNNDNDNLEDIFNKLLNKYYYFDIQLGYFSYLNYLENNNLDTKNKKIKFNEIRKDYQFKNSVKKIYNEKCVITNVDIDECSICHIKPLSESNFDEKYDYNNGLILSESLHRLYDKFLFTINPETFEIIISDKIKNKNLSINKYNSKKLSLNLSSKIYLEYHYNIFNKNNFYISDV
jgi:hypothetical protein